MEKLTWTRYGLTLLAGLAGFACSQEAREPAEVGTVQVELRSDLIYSKTPGSSLVLPAEEGPNPTDESANSMPDPQHIALSELKDYSKDRDYDAVKRYEFLPALLKQSVFPKSFGPEVDVHASSWVFVNKHRVRGGKGFGVAAKGMVPAGTVHPDDASYYVPTVALKSFSKASEHMEPVTEPFKSRKPLVFHRGGTGFAHELPPDSMHSDDSLVFGARPKFPPTSEAEMYSKPKTRITWAPANNRLDLMNGNPSLNRHRFHKLH